jgi:hypothetical protein
LEKGSQSTQEIESKAKLQSEMEGILWKQSPRIHHQYQKRWFLVAGNMLYYWKSRSSDSEAKPAVAIVLDGIKVMNVDEKHYTFELHVQRRFADHFFKIPSFQHLVA